MEKINEQVFSNGVRSSNRFSFFTVSCNLWRAWISRVAARRKQNRSVSACQITLPRRLHEYIWKDKVFFPRWRHPLDDCATRIPRGEKVICHNPKERFCGLSWIERSNPRSLILLELSGEGTSVQSQILWIEVILGKTLPTLRMISYLKLRKIRITYNTNTTKINEIEIDKYVGRIYGSCKASE